MHMDFQLRGDMSHAPVTRRTSANKMVVCFNVSGKTVLCLDPEQDSQTARLFELSNSRTRPAWTCIGAVVSLCFSVMELLF
jgi:hypothetical protein